MKVLLNKPNLPDGRVTCVLLGEEYLERLERPLGDLGIGIISLPADPALAVPVRSHADMSALHLGGERFVAARSAQKALRDAGLDPFAAESERAETYPLDVGLNICIIGKSAFLNMVFADKMALAKLKSLDFKLYNVKQGYARCSVCVLDAAHIITQDAGIYTAALDAGIDALKIRPGGVALPGYDSGFLGGCCGKISPDRLAFTGRLDKHPDYAAIVEYMGKIGVEPVFLTDKPVFDIGGIIPIYEEK